jgi:glycerophosphoryl diester phosphodiesterase
MLGPGVFALAKHPKFAERMVRSGRDLHVWTVNTQEHLDLCRSLGVSAVITDRPRAVLGWLDEAEELEAARPLAGSG